MGICPPCRPDPWCASPAMQWPARPRPCSRVPRSRRLLALLDACGDTGSESCMNAIHAHKRPCSCANSAKAGNACPTNKSAQNTCRRCRKARDDSRKKGEMPWWLFDSHQGICINRDKIAVQPKAVGWGCTLVEARGQTRRPTPSSLSRC